MKSRKAGIIITYVNIALSMISGLYFSSFYIKTLGAAEYGVYQTAASFANYLVLLEFGTGSVIVRNLSICYSRGADKNELDRNTSTIWAINCLLSMVILMMSMVFYSAMDNIYARSMTSDQIMQGKRILLVVSLNLVFSFFQQTFNGIALANENYSFSAKLSIIHILIKAMLITGILLRYRHAVVIAVIDAFMALVMAVYSFVYCKAQYNVSFSIRKFDWRICKSAFPLSAAIFIQAIVNQANSNVDKFVIGIKLNPESVTLYGVALFVYTCFSRITTAPISLYAPQTIKAVSSGIRGKALVDDILPASRLIVLLGGTILFGFVVVGRQFVTILYGAEYILAWSIAIVIMVPMMLNMTTGVLVNVLDAENKRMVRSGVLFFTTLANVILTILWIDRFGMIGAALATAICTIAGQVTLMNIFYSKRMNIPILYMYRESYRGILLPQLIGAAAAMFLIRNIHNAYVSFFTGGFSYVVIVYVGCRMTGSLKRLGLK